MNELLDILKFAGLALSAYLMVTVVIALIREDNSVMDIAYGSAFVLVAWCLALMWPIWSERQVIILACVTVWGIRLTTRIFLKNRGKPEDIRYSIWRKEWQEKGMLYFFFRSFGQIYLLQGAVILVVALPILVVFTVTQTPLVWYNWLGLAVWCIGLFFEVVGDYQLDRFIRNPENQGKIMMSGLWKYTRHPNYFGEATMWWGLFLVALGLPLSELVLASPILITFLLTQVSGIPMLEARWAGHPDWEVYKKRTSAFIPWFPKIA